MNVWVGSPIDIRYNNAAIEALKVKSDAEYWNQNEGVVKVPIERWLEAQHFERTGWLQTWLGAEDDRSLEHKHLFGQYSQLPIDLGSVIEVGCGPFTQLATIAKTHRFNDVTLLDPLLNDYLTLPTCTYRNDKLFKSRNLLPIKLEDLDIHESFDTLICINVLEHVIDAYKCLDNIYNALKIGGYIVFGEKSFDSFDPTQSFDIGHPIHVRSAVLDKFISQFSLLFSNNYYIIGRK